MTENEHPKKATRAAAKRAEAELTGNPAADAATEAETGGSSVVRSIATDDGQAAVEPAVVRSIAKDT
jgi:hypothetical protein